MGIENANSHPYKVAIVKDSTMFANTHPFKVQIEGGGGSEARVVDELPETGETGYIYLVLKEESEEGDIYDEYMWVLQQDGETYAWEHIGATNEVTIKLYDSTGQNTDGAMTQLATTSMVFADPATQKRVKIGAANSGSDGSVVIGSNAQGGILSTADIVIGVDAYAANGDRNVVIGASAQTRSNSSHSIAIGASAKVDSAVRGAIALGPGAHATVSGVMDIGASLMTDRGYNNTVYRLLTGLYNGQNDHDAVTVGQLNTAIAEVEVAEINSTDWSALWQ